MVQIRIKFKKNGKLQFISHLDLNRTMKHAMIRAEIPIWYSEGYNPRPKIVFALPLSIGIESICEFMDIKIIEDIPLDEVKFRLNQNLTDELAIIDVYEPTTKFTEIEWAEYKITLNFSSENIVSAEKIQNMLERPLVITKKTKSGSKDVDILPYIKNVNCNYCNNSINISALLCANNENYLNPEYIVKSCLYTNFDFYSILRVATYKADGEIFK